MSDAVFNLIDRQKLLSGEADYGTGQVSAPPGVEAYPVGAVLDARIGRHRVRFLGVVADGIPQFLTIWKPDKPKQLKPALVKKYRRERRNFVTTVAKQFGLAFQIIDRMDGAPRITELVSHDGAVVPVVPPIPSYSPRFIDERSRRRHRVSIPRLGAYPDPVARQEARLCRLAALARHR